MKLKNTFIMTIALRVAIVLACTSLVVVKYAAGTKFASDLPPLIYSVMNLETVKVKDMLKEGYFVGAFDERGDTSLHHAVEDGDDVKAIQLARLLLSNFACAQDKNRNGQTAIHLTREIDNITRRIEVIDWLVKNGANVSERDHRGNSILDDLAESNMASDLEMTLMWWGDFFTKDDIVKATKKAEYFEYDSPRKLLERFDLKKYTAPEQRDLSTLMIAIFANDIPSVNALVLKANLKEGSEKTFGYRPLHIAVNANKFEAVKILLEQGADANAPDSNGNTPIFMIEHLQNNASKKELIDLLVRHNANINARNSSGDTVLHVAVKKRDIQVITYLLSVPGILPSIKNNQGLTPKVISKNFKYADIQALFDAKKL